MVLEIEFKKHIHTSYFGHEFVWDVANSDMFNLIFNFSPNELFSNDVKNHFPSDILSSCMLSSPSPVLLMSQDGEHNLLTNINKMRNTTGDNKGRYSLRWQDIWEEAVYGMIAQ